MKKILNKIGQVLQVVLMAPVKLPGKAVNILKYVALGLGILETVIADEAQKEGDSTEKVTGEDGPDTADGFYRKENRE